MTDSQPFATPRSKRIYVLWGVALALLLFNSLKWRRCGAAVQGNAHSALAA